MTKERVAYLRKHDPDYFERTGFMGGEKIKRERGTAWYSFLGKLSAAKRRGINLTCTNCGSPCCFKPDRVECSACGWKIYTFQAP